MRKVITEGSELDGYEHLRPEDQAKVVKAVQEGHVADEDIPKSARKTISKKKHKKAKWDPVKEKVAAAAKVCFFFF